MFYLYKLSCILFFVSIAYCATGQKQLVLLKGQNVKLRLYGGDDFNFRLKGSKTIRRSYINNLYDTAVVAHRDVIPFHKIDRVYFDQGNFANVVGGLLVAGGVGYFLIDQVNLVIVNKQEPAFEKSVLLPSAIMISTGLPMMLIKKRSQKLGGRFRLLVVEKGSPFYLPERKPVNSPFFQQN